MAPKSKKEQQKITVVVEEAEASAPRQGTQLPNDGFVEKLTELIHNGTLGETLNVAYERVYTLVSKDSQPTAERCPAREPTSVKEAVKSGMSCLFAGTLSQISLKQTAFPGDRVATF